MNFTVKNAFDSIFEPEIKKGKERTGPIDPGDQVEPIGRQPSVTIDEDADCTCRMIEPRPRRNATQGR
jgi:hypothetical protein